MGLLAVFSFAVSITMEWREVAAPTYRSLSVQFTDASVMVAFFITAADGRGRPSLHFFNGGYRLRARGGLALEIIPGRRV